MCFTRCVIVFSSCVFPGDFNGFRAGLHARGPEFLLEPNENYYVVKNQPVIVTCKARGAVHISFQCANKWIKQEQSTTRESIDPLTQKNVVETSIKVTREEVEEYFGSDGYWCDCYASAKQPGTAGEVPVKSEKRGYIELACKYQISIKFLPVLQQPYCCAAMKSLYSNCGSSRTLSVGGYQSH